MADQSYPIGMFPLSTVLLPNQALPLHVFEPRYRRLVADCLDADAEDASGRFVVVLIVRESEVGGGDERAAVATASRIEAVARRATLLLSEMSDVPAIGPGTVLAADPREAAWQLCEQVPVGTHVLVVAVTATSATSLSFVTPWVAGLSGPGTGSVKATFVVAVGTHLSNAVQFTYLRPTS